MAFITEVFLSFDLEATFSSAVILLMARPMDDFLSENHHSRVEIAYNVLDEMTSRGNIIAQSRKMCLKHLERAFVSFVAPVPDASHALVSQGGLSADEVPVQQYARRASNLPSTTIEDEQFYPEYQPFDWPESLSELYLRSAVDSFGTNEMDWFFGALSNEPTE
jgi:proline utilization trans-activator